MLRPNANAPSQSSAEFALLLIDIVDLKEINSAHGRDIGDQALRHVAEATRRTIRMGDLLFRYRSDEFVVFLSGADAGEALRLAKSIRESIGSRPLVVGAQNTLRIETTVTPLPSPGEGGSLVDFIAKARSKAHRESASEGSIH